MSTASIQGSDQDSSQGSGQSPDRPYWVTWSKLPHIGPIRLQRLWKHFGSLEAAWRADSGALLEVEGVGLGTAMEIEAQRSRFDPQACYAAYAQQNLAFWTPADAGYPRLLLEIPDPPPMLHYRGRVEPAESQGQTLTVAIVGTRRPTEYGRRWTHRISRALAQAGVTIVSGLAEGVDAIAHRSCLEAGGRTLAVMGTGVDVIYPWSNRSLARQVTEQGLLLSEYPAGTQPDRAQFPRRNRIIAGLSRAVLILEAPQKSGALITARVANDYARDVYALPGSVESKASRGCLELISQGASLILDEPSLLEAVGAMPTLGRPEPAPAPPDLPPDLAQVLDAVKDDPRLLDQIAAQTSLGTGTILSALAQLEMMDLVRQLPGMRYQRC
ncbi:MAG: DNA-processing protein DprA [Elainellaceae cyanobacterium]